MRGRVSPRSVRDVSLPAAPPAPSEAVVSVDGDHGLRLLSEMIRIRRFEERCVELYSSTAIRGFVHLYIGEEAVAVGVMQSLSAEDAVVATYREHGDALACGIPASAVMAEMYGPVEGSSRGRGGSMHIFDLQRRFYGGNAVVGVGLPVAAGLALADRLEAGRGHGLLLSERGRSPRASSTRR